MAEKVTDMVLKVNLQCPRCYKKVKKILCKFPLRSMRAAILLIHLYSIYKTYIKRIFIHLLMVVCCNPEKIRDKLCCKGSKVIKSIEIKKPKGPDKQQENAHPQGDAEETSKNGPSTGPQVTKPPSPESIPVNGFPPDHVPVRTCCGPCYEGYGGGPCYHGYRVPPPPQPCYGGYYGYGYDRPFHVTRCNYYFIEENPRACSIM